jgi:endonuclease/exonuclease/phosphatase family metal-dependent hydrolase
MPGLHTLRVLTLNIAHGRGLSTYQGFHTARGIERSLKRVAHLLNQVGADIVALQEVDEDSHWNRRIHLLDSIQKQTEYSHAYLGVHNRRAGKLPLAYGNGLLTRFPIVHAEHTAFGRASLGEKGFMCAELQTPHGILPVVNLHLDFRSRVRRIEQIERLIQFLDDKKYTREGTPHLSPIVCGDFNSRSGKPGDAVRHLFTYLHDQCEYALCPTGRKSRTFPSLAPVHGLDFIFVPPSYKVRSSEVLRSYVSDHRPVLIDLDILSTS